MTPIRFFILAIVALVFLTASQVAQAVAGMAPVLDALA